MRNFSHKKLRPAINGKSWKPLQMVLDLAIESVVGPVTNLPAEKSISPFIADTYGKTHKPIEGSLTAVAFRQHTDPGGAFLILTPHDQI
jgi:hypothetical protein